MDQQQVQIQFKGLKDGESIDEAMARDGYKKVGEHLYANERGHTVSTMQVDPNKEDVDKEIFDRVRALLEQEMKEPPPPEEPPSFDKIREMAIMGIGERIKTHTAMVSILNEMVDEIAARTPDTPSFKGIELFLKYKALRKKL